MMHPVRRKRLTAVLFLVLGVSITTALVLGALRENMNLFYTPDQIVAGVVPEGVRIRAGGLVKENSVQRAAEGLTVEFIVSDMIGAEFPVQYTGILPALFREGQSVIATGRLDGNGRLIAEEVLARHDEEYIPAELMQMHEAQRREGRQPPRAHGALRTADMDSAPAAAPYAGYGGDGS
jgi:cytochrome c-type biogenesis protein CcmE